MARHRLPTMPIPTAMGDPGTRWHLCRSTLVSASTITGAPITIADTGSAMAGIEALITVIADTGEAGARQGTCYPSRTVIPLTVTYP